VTTLLEYRNSLPLYTKHFEREVGNTSALNTYQASMNSGRHLKNFAEWAWSAKAAGAVVVIRIAVFGSVLRIVI
jgi:hypothetical protein